MLKSLSFSLLLSLLLVPISSNRSPVYGQERQGCFMVNSQGRLLDLSEICPTAQTVMSDTPTLGTGDIQTTLRWATTDDLDLYVTDPQGQTVFFGNSSVPSGGQLDVDANAGCAGGTQTPIENIFWPTGQAPQGSYSIEVNLFSRCTGDTAPIPFEIRLLVQGEVQTLTGNVSEQNPSATFPFTLP